jgi:ParB family chromosome partitioning protein
VIVPSTTNPRKSFDDASMADLTASVREAGVQSPILLRRVATTKSTDGIIARAWQGIEFEIVCGERRFRAAKAAGLETIPAIVRDLDDETAYQAQIIENLQREDLGPMEEAESYGRLTWAGVAVIDIASKVGKSGAYVAHRLQLLKLIDKGQNALRKGELPLGHAMEIAKLAEDEQAEALAEVLEDNFGNDGMDLADLKDYIQRTFRLDLSKAPFDLKSASMSPEAGPCIDCGKRTGANTLLFSDVKAGDHCLDAKCYGVKVQTVIHVRVEELKKKQDTVPLLSYSYRAEGKPGTLGSADYELVRKERPCGSAVHGVMVDGAEVGKKVKVCIDKSCKVHHHYSSGGSSSSAAGAKRKKENAKLRRDTEVRLRTAKSVVDHVMSSRLSDDDVNIDDALDLAEFAFRRMDHMQDGRLAKALNWHRDAMGHRSDDRKDMLSGMGIRKATALAVLATVANDLTVQGSSGRSDAERLNRVAERNGVDVEAIEALVDAEIQAKAEKKETKIGKTEKVLAPKAPAAQVPAAKKKAVAVKKAAVKKPVKKLAPAARKQIAAAMKKRWAARKKASG